MTNLIFRPKPDITAYELARILQRLARVDSVRQILTQNQVNELPRELQRHWVPVL